MPSPRRPSAICRSRSMRRSRSWSSRRSCGARRSPPCNGSTSWATSGPRASIGHGIFLDHHPWVRWGTRTDLGRLAETGTSVAHCPTVFVRRGVDAARPRQLPASAGVNVGIGTDTYPHNMLEEMRHAGVYARITAETPFNVTSGDVFRCATLGGAKLLGARRHRPPRRRRQAGRGAGGPHAPDDAAPPRAAAQPDLRRRRAGRAPRVRRRDGRW